MFLIDSWGTSCEITLRWMSLDITDEKKINIDSGNGLVPLGSKPLP